MTTKKEAALGLLGLALDMYRARDGDEHTDSFILRVLWAADSLDPQIIRHDRYSEINVGIFNGVPETREAKLRRMIEHPSTPPAEREAAVAALNRVRRAKEDVK